MLAGRKLLLADDSVTIQKVIDLTFADEGVEVIAVGDGTDAIEKIEQLMPDVVLADVYMPGFNGYEVCEYIKGSEKLKHIPVMLLVGSFEPFDEVEARRVGANDILTKPFQSIRRLIEKVGDLVNTKPPETEAQVQPATEIATAELPKQEPEEPKLSTAEIEMTTADTLQLPEQVAHQAAAEAAAPTPVVNENKVDSPMDQMNKSAFTETPLELEDFGSAEALADDDDDFELELDFDEPEPAPEPAYAAPVYSEPQVAPASKMSWERASEVAVLDREVEVAASPEPARYDYQAPVREASAAAVRATDVRLTDEDLSPEMIDKIARRAVELLSEKVVQEIAWEVVPQLAELLIKRRLEEQPK